MNNQIAVETKVGICKKENACPCMSMVRVSAEAIAKELEFAIGTIIDEEVGSRFIYLLEDMHKEKKQTDFAVEVLHIMLELIQADYSLALMNTLDFTDKRKMNYFMNTFFDAILIELFADDEED